MKHIIYITIILLGMFCPCQGQTTGKFDPENYPKIGQPCPEFILNDIHHYKKKRASLENFKGKWLVLYFWSRGCSSSITGFMELEELRKQFSDKFTFMLVGRDTQTAKDIYKAYRDKYSLKLSSAYEKELAERFGTAGYPHIVIVDPKGTVREIAYQVTATGLENLIKGKESGLGHSQNKAEKESGEGKYDRRRLFMVDGNGGGDNDFTYRSILAKWQPYMLAKGIVNFRSTSRKNEVLIASASLSRLYLLAYNDRKPLIPVGDNDYVDWWYKPLLKVRDTSLFDPQTNNRFTYSLIVPKDKADIAYMQKIMQNDLESYFGYKVSVEKRMMPYYKLTATKKAKEKLLTSGKPMDEFGDGIINYTIINQPISRVVKALWAYNQSGPPFVDETGIDYNIDMKLKGVFTDLEDMKRILSGYGLSLELSKKEMNVVIVSDP